MITQYLNTIPSLSNHNNKRIYPSPPPSRGPRTPNNNKKYFKTPNDKGLILSNTVMLSGLILDTSCVR